MAVDDGTTLYEDDDYYNQADDYYVELGARRQSVPPDTTGAAARTNTTPPPFNNQNHRGFRVQYRAFAAMALPYYFGSQQQSSRAPRMLFGIMMGLTLLHSAVRVVFSYLARDFWSALSENRVDEFYRDHAPLCPGHDRVGSRQCVLSLYATKAGDSLAGMDDRAGPAAVRLEPSCLLWTRTTIRRRRGWCGDEQQRENISIDNPDQRIAQDVRSFTEYSLSLFLTVLTALIDLLCFGAILFTILPRLFLAIALFATVGTAMTILIGRVLVQLNFEKLQKEADFRFSLVRMRENAESIAFLKGEEVEKRQVRHRFSRVIENMHSINGALRNLEFFTTYYTYLTWVLPILVIAPSYFAGEVELGVVQQAAASFSHVLDDLSILVTQWESLSEFSAGIDRLYTFLIFIQALDPDRPEGSPLMSLPGQPSVWNPPKAAGATSTSSSKTTMGIDLIQQTPVSDLGTTSEVASCKDPALTIQNLCLLIPGVSERVLIRNLNMSVPWGENLLIVGPSGVGKSSLLRAIAGLWDAGSGSIQRVHDEDAYFLPQKPYCASGSLRDQLLYPATAADEDLEENSLDRGSRTIARVLRQRPSDERLLEILKAVDLAELPGRAGLLGLDAIQDWSNMLSLGEQQRLAFGRILVNQPRFVIMDESTSALDVEAETRMYALLKKMPWSSSNNGSFGSAPLTYVTVGHRPSLLVHHDTKLILNGEQWSVEPIHS